MRFAPGILLFVLSASTAFHSAYAQQGITLDPATGDYTITYFATDNNGNERLRQTTFVPKTKIKPTIRSEFESDHMVRIKYRYTLTNRAGAAQAINLFVLDPVSSIITSQVIPQVIPTDSQGIVDRAKVMIRAEKDIRTPALWEPSMTDSRKEGFRQGGFRIGWGFHDAAAGLWPSTKQPAFGFESSDLPGLVNAEVAGNGPAGQGLGENGPDSDEDSDFARQYDYLIIHDYVDVPVAVPAIKPSTPVDLKDIASQLQAHVRTWPALHVMDQATASKIDALLQQTIVALTASDARAASASLKAVRQLLRQSHPGYEADDDRNDDNNRDQASNTGRPVSKLAAKVLGFDVQFLLRQMNNGRDAED
jgi:hypothetical protein